MDVHVPRAVTTALRLRSIDVLTAQQDGAAQCDVSQDQDLLREGVRRLRAGEDFSGIVYAHQMRVTIGQMVEDLELIATATSKEEWWDRIPADLTAPPRRTSRDLRPHRVPYGTMSL